MKSSREILSSALKTTQMGQVGIRCVMNAPVHTDLKKALRSQLQEYDTIEREAQALAFTRGWNLEDLDPALKVMAKMAVKTTLTGSNTSSKVAAMMIEGNTRGMIKSLKNLHRYAGCDQSVSALAHKLLQCEEENITQMRSFV